MLCFANAMQNTHRFLAGLQWFERGKPVKAAAAQRMAEADAENRPVPV
jgi:hypothetical protein